MIVLADLPTAKSHVNGALGLTAMLQNLTDGGNLSDLLCFCNKACFWCESERILW